MNTSKTRKTGKKILLIIAVLLFIAFNFSFYHFNLSEIISDGFRKLKGNSHISDTDNSPSDALSPSDPYLLLSIECDSAYAVYAGDTITPVLTFVPSSAQTSLSYSISGTDIASIDQNGTVTGNKPGTATVTVTATPEVTVSFNIVVRKKMPDPALDYPENYDDKPVVVNKKNPLSEDYKPEVVKTREVVPSKAADLSLDAEALAQYAKMYEDCKKATKQEVILITGYRSYAVQRYIHEKSVKRYINNGYSEKRAIALASRSVQPPGNSEHQLGLSIDIGTTSSISSTFHKTKAGAWITAHAHEYGWILRYPSDKKSITGISYEPWHFRYVGVEHATYIYKHKICLEEYVKLQDEAAQNAIEYSAAHPAACD